VSTTTVISYLLTFAAGFVVGGMLVGAGMLSTFRPALNIARMRAESAETERDLLLLEIHNK
jgi:hypothetical protein